ncbi:hypothetical protein AN958_02962 [Leucoagaricus sp. SymC.cos]|nr:hypothetical protein AN958_02962 [Leucoagaricus sp. SymC.cos]
MLRIMERKAFSARLRNFSLEKGGRLVGSFGRLIRAERGYDWAKERNAVT